MIQILGFSFPREIFCFDPEPEEEMVGRGGCSDPAHSPPQAVVGSLPGSLPDPPPVSVRTSAPGTYALDLGQTAPAP